MPAVSGFVVTAALVVVCAVTVPASTALVGGAHQCTPLFHRAVLPALGTGGFNDVLALAVDNVWAVGGVGKAPDGSDRHALVAHWDGRSWSILPSPNPLTGSELSALAGTSANDLWAVGSSWSAHFESVRPLIVHWDGRAWRRAQVAGLLKAGLDGVSAVAPDDVWAVGGSVSVHWNGRGWSELPTPANDALHAVLPWRHRVIAVGVRDYLGSNTPLIEEWSGGRWRVVFTTERRGTLWSAAIAGTTMWGVGGFPILRWNDRWRVSESPRVIPKAPVARTADVTVGFGGTWVIVGRVPSSGPRSTLARWTGHDWVRARAVTGSLLAIDARTEGVWAAGISGVGQRGYLASGTPLIGLYTC